MEMMKTSHSEILLDASDPDEVTFHEDFDETFLNWAGETIGENDLPKGCL